MVYDHRRRDGLRDSDRESGADRGDSPKLQDGARGPYGPVLLAGIHLEQSGHHRGPFRGDRETFDHPGLADRIRQEFGPRTRELTHANARRKAVIGFVVCSV